MRDKDGPQCQKQCQRRRCPATPALLAAAKSLKINNGCNAGVAGVALQNRGLQVRFLPGLFRSRCRSCSQARQCLNARTRTAAAREGGVAVATDVAIRELWPALPLEEG